MKPQFDDLRSDICFGQRLFAEPLLPRTPRPVYGPPLDSTGQDRGRTQAGYDRRLHDRVKTRFHANAYCHGRFQTVLVRNVSFGGLMMRDAFGLGVGDPVTVRTLAGRSYTGRVVWSVIPWTGLAFDEPLDADDPVFHPVFCAGEMLSEPVD